MIAGADAQPRSDVLSAIVAATLRTVEVRRELMPPDALERQAEAASPRGQLFADALRAPGRVNVIAECKRRSPSKGVLRADYDPVMIAAGYARAGAAAISVLTEPSFFDGSLEHLAAVRAAVDLPVLRKDFVVDEYQLLEARAAGADAVLLIVAALNDQSLRELLQAARALGLAPLVEVHTREEASRASDAGADIVGVNSRNLRTLEVSLDVALDVVGDLDGSTIAVAESGIRSSADIDTLARGGFHAFLIGERLMTEDDPGAALARLVSGGAC